MSNSFKEGWEVRKLGDFLSIKHGFAFNGESITDEEQNYILMTPGNFNIGGGFKSNKFKYFSGEFPQEYLLRKDDIVVTMTDLSKEGDTLGYPAIIPNNNKFLHNQRIGLCVINEKEICKKYIYYLMCSKEYRHEILASATGTSIKHTAPKRIENFSFKLPPLETQQKIAKVLGDLDDKIELNHQMNQTLEGMAQALFKSWFVDFDPVRAKADVLHAGGTQEQATLSAMSIISGKSAQELEAFSVQNPDDYKALHRTATLFPSSFTDSPLGPIPEGWEVKKVEELSEKIGMGPFGSNIKVSTFVDKGIPIISGQHLNNTLFEEKDYNFITEEHAHKLKSSIVFSGDLIFTHAGNIGQVSLIPEKVNYQKFIISQRQFYLRPIKKEISSYLIYFFRSSIGQHKLLSNASQVGVPSIARPSSHLKTIELISPCLAILEIFDIFCKNIFSSIIEYKNNSKTLTQIRDGLLPKLLSGEIEVS